MVIARFGEVPSKCPISQRLYSIRNFTLNIEVPLPFASYIFSQKEGTFKMHFITKVKKKMIYIFNTTWTGQLLDK